MPPFVARRYWDDFGFGTLLVDGDSRLRWTFWLAEANKFEDWFIIRRTKERAHKPKKPRPQT